MMERMELSQDADSLADELCYLIYEDMMDREHFAAVLREVADYYEGYYDIIDHCCLDCGKDTMGIREYYMVHKELWLKAHPEDKGMLCIGCLENRLGRELEAGDFTECPVNDNDEEFTKSQRLMNRLGR